MEYITNFIGDLYKGKRGGFYQLCSNVGESIERIEASGGEIKAVIPNKDELEVCVIYKREL